MRPREEVQGLLSSCLVCPPPSQGTCHSLSLTSPHTPTGAPLCLPHRPHGSEASPREEAPPRPISPSTEGQGTVTLHPSLVSSRPFLHFCLCSECWLQCIRENTRFFFSLAKKDEGSDFKRASSRFKTKAQCRWWTGWTAAKEAWVHWKPGGA